MKESLLVSLIVITIYIYLYFSKRSIVYIRSTFDNQSYLVRNDVLKNKSADLLAQLISNIYKLREFLINNKGKFKKFRKYIDQFEINVAKGKTRIFENDGDDGYTSYSVNKGEEIVFCLKSKKSKSLHSLNLLMYVAIHELAHCACPDTGHTPLFKEIFAFLTEKAIKLGLYKKVDYHFNPVEYCGMILSSSII